MGSFSDYAENKILDHLFGKGNYTPPTIYVGLSTTDPGDSGAGLSEPSGNGYARVVTTPADWNAAAGGLLDNAHAITLGPATGDWGTLTHFALFDAAGGGHLLLHGALVHPKTIESGDSARFAGGELTVTLD
ncbi:MAG: hypothetical protein FJ280_27925 [Planctomycetes bacterium]|nr:hypothetical protein [Planctomycetota bacterium]